MSINKAKLVLSPYFNKSPTSTISTSLTANSQNNSLASLTENAQNNSPQPASAQKV
jgi:hypothetical protein